MASVRLREVTKEFGKVRALDNLSLEVADGEFVVILGPSGCGKSTTLHCIAGLEEVDSGEILIGDKIVNGLEPKSRDVAMVFQNYALYPHMTVEENIAFPLRMHKFKEDETKIRVKKAADTLRIGHLLDRKPKQVSGGEAQRVALARAIVREPVVFLMDEPLSNLDANLRLHMRVELKKIQQELRTTTIYVTHDQAEALTMGDKVAVMQSGTVQQFAEPLQIYSKPFNTFIASFVGSPPMNLIEGEVKYDGASRTTFASNDLALEMPQDLRKALDASGNPSKILIGIRPEDLSTVSSYNNSLKIGGGIVYEIEPLGSHSIVNVKVGDTILKIQEGSYYSYKDGEQVTVHISKERMHIFDGSTKRMIV